MLILARDAWLGELTVVMHCCTWGSLNHGIFGSIPAPFKIANHLPLLSYYLSVSGQIEDLKIQMFLRPLHLWSPLQIQPVSIGI